MAVTFFCAVMMLCSMTSSAQGISAQSAIVYDCATGRVLYEKNPNQKSLIASTTKIMTGYLVAQNCDPDQKVTIPAEACGIEGSSLYLKPGEQLTIRQLLYGLMLQSGNDAAVALAICSHGSVPAFVDAMNEKAAELGLCQTHFANPNGLDDDGNYSTAADLAKLTAAALDNTLFAQVVATKTMKIPGRNLANHNKMLWRYEGADGVKTGFTKAAGRILVSSATRDGRQLVAVTINAPDDWNDHKIMLDDAFADFTQRVLVEPGQMICELAVVGGTKTYCNVVADEKICFPMAEGERVSYNILAPDFLYAPVEQGTCVGTAEICIDGKPIAQCQLLAQDTVTAARKEERTIWQKIFGN